MALRLIPVSWHGYVAAAAAVMAGVAATQKKWTSAAIEAAMCIFFFVREAQVQHARQRGSRSSGDPE